MSTTELDLAAAARMRVGVTELLTRLAKERLGKNEGWINAERSRGRQGRAPPAGADTGRLQVGLPHAGGRCDRLGQDRHAGLDAGAPHRRGPRGRDRPEGRRPPPQRGRAGRVRRRPLDSSNGPLKDRRPTTPTSTARRGRARRQGAGRRDVHRAPLPAPRPALSRPRDPRRCRPPMSASRPSR